MTELPEDATTAYLFFNSEELLNAITRDKNGRNLPLLGGSWTFTRQVTLGVQEPFQGGIDPEPALRGLRADGYFIWTSNSFEPFGTSQ
jgi:hypothetical protein